MTILQRWFRGTFAVWAFVSCAFGFAVEAQSPEHAGLKFYLAPRHKIGLNTTDIVYKDLDGDSFLDIAVVNGGQENPSPTITVRFGTSGGEFGSPLVLPSYTIGQTIDAGDLNGDGRPDLVIGSFYHNRLAVFLNLGNRQFAAPWFSAPPDPPYGGNPNTGVGEFLDLAIADFDGDGNNDVVALQDQTNQRLRFFHFSGQGLLTVFATLDQIGNETSYERKMAVGDVNGDYRPDIVFAGGGPFGARTICFVFGQPSGGTLSMTYGWDVADKAVGISIEDLDNDGDRDLSVAFLDVTTPTRHSLQVFRNNGSASFTALPKIFLEYPFPPTDITTDDFNNDGKRDIGALIGSVYANGLMVLVMNGIGDGTFVEQGYYATSPSSSIYSTDIDRDGKIDILTASSFLDQTDYTEDGNTVSILFNDNFQRFRAPLATLWGPNFIDAGDFNSDGYKDLVSSWATNFTTSGVDILINDRAGGLLPEVHHPSPAWLNGMKTGDFNGDGKSDAFSIHRDKLATYSGNGNGSIAEPVITQFARPLVNIIVCDFNSDGNDDVFLVDDLPQGHSMLSNGNGTFSAAPGSPMSVPSDGGGIPELQSGDFNSDHKIDLILYQNNNVELWLGDGAGRFAQAPATIPPLGRLVPGDFNGDGKLDIAGMANDGLRGSLGDGSGGFSAGFYRPIEGTYSINLASSVVSADFDLDGRDDVAILMADNYNGNLIIMQYEGGGGTPSWKQPIFYGVGPAYRTWGGMLVATDFNSDRKPDIGYLGDNARGVIYNTTRQNNSVFDFDGDGKTDLSIFRPASGEWWWLKSSNGDTGAVQFGISTDNVASADYTGDGKTDVAFWRPSTGQWFVLRSEDLTFYAFPFGSNGDVPVPADYDGDGKADAAVFRQSSLTWYISKSSGGTEIVGFGAAGDKPVNADYDGDGKSDIAIFRPNGTNGAEWWVRRSSNASVFATQFGSPTDKAVPADYTGDGKADIAFWTPSNGNWFILRSEDLSYFAFPFGSSTDIPSPGDYDGDGKTDAAVFRPSNSTWYANRSTAGLLIQQFGSTGDVPVPGAFVR